MNNSQRSLTRPPDTLIELRIISVNPTHTPNPNPNRKGTHTEEITIKSRIRSMTTDGKVEALIQCHWGWGEGLQAPFECHLRL
jgi:hypothetical protein